MRYKCPQCGRVWTEGGWTEFTHDRYCSDGCRSAHLDALTPRTKCDWCGNMYESGTGCCDAADNHYCSNRCYNEAMKDPSIRAKVEAEEERERRRQEAEARRRREEAAAAAKREAEERARKADPNRWYPSEWVDHLKTRPADGAKCPWTRLSFKVSDWVELLKAQPCFYDKCNAWGSFDWEDWNAVLGPCLKTSGFAASVERRLNGAGWANLLTRSVDFDARCNWSSLRTNDWAHLLRYRSEFSSRCTCWADFTSSDWCALLPGGPRFWIRAWRCDWFSVSDYEWKTLVSSAWYLKPFRVYMFFAAKFDKFLNGVGGLFVLAAIILILIAIIL